MAYDEELAHRIRALLAEEEGVTEMAMFGGLAFLLGGNMAVAASGQGGLLVRAGPAAGERLLAGAHVSPMVMRGREMKGWLRVEAEAVRGKRELARWVLRGVDFARSLPPKG
jgi:TfoX N-terminal domain